MIKNSFHKSFCSADVKVSRRWCRLGIQSTAGHILPAYLAFQYAFYYGSLGDLFFSLLSRMQHLSFFYWNSSFLQQRLQILASKYFCVIKFQFYTWIVSVNLRGALMRNPTCLWVFVWPLLSWFKKNLFRHLIPRMSWRGFVWGKLRQRRVSLSRQRLNLLLLLWLQLDTLSGALWRDFHSTEEATLVAVLAHSLLVPPKPFVVHLDSKSCPSCLPSIALELWWITQLKDLLCRGFCREGFEQDKTCPQQTMLCFLLIAANKGFPLGTVLYFLLSLHRPLQKKMLLNYLVLCCSSAHSWLSPKLQSGGSE